MRGLRDLLSSERGAWCAVVLIISIVFMLTRQLTSESWIDLIKFLTMVLVASKTVTTAVETRTLKEPQIPPARVVER
jgi:hypothetical protein